MGEGQGLYKKQLEALPTIGVSVTGDPWLSLPARRSRCSIRQLLQTQMRRRAICKSSFRVLPQQHCQVAATNEHLLQQLHFWKSKAAGILHVLGTGQFVAFRVVAARARVTEKGVGGRASDG